jgi:hypothetical protein
MEELASTPDTDDATCWSSQTVAAIGGRRHQPGDAGVNSTRPHDMIRPSKSLVVPIVLAHPSAKIEYATRTEVHGQ